MIADPFQIGRIYNRRRDIHASYGGQMQGGISTPADHTFVFLFTGEIGEQYGYKDGWSNDRVFLYTGEGQIGDMQFVRGNKAIRDHAAEGKELLLFEALGKGSGYRYLGAFTCASWDFQTAPDKEGAVPRVIRFHLLQADGSPALSPADDIGAQLETDLATLSAVAIAASKPAGDVKVTESRARYYFRARAVRAYVLARADGRCECCKQPAPFERIDGSPYLEPHHTNRLSDVGPDDPRWVAGVCPTCHRRIHHGKGGDSLNVELQAYLRSAEGVKTHGH